MTDSELQSKSIDFLRFPLIIGVIFIHNFSLGRGISDNMPMPVYRVTSELFSYVISAVAVPLFFIFSGFLFFLNTDFNKKCYFSKLRKRIYTLLVPYLFWNIAALVCAWITHRFVPNDYQDCLTALWSVRSLQETSSLMTYPIAYQFWFIRDLMVIMLMVPFIYCLIRYLKIYFIAALAIVWYFKYWPEILECYGLKLVALFFFTLGAWFSLNKKNLIIEAQKIKKICFIFYPIIALVDLYTKGTVFTNYISPLSILLGVFIFLNLAALAVCRNILMREFSIASFFVFAIHDPWLLSQIRKVYLKIFVPDTDLQLTIAYFVIPLMVAVIALCIYYSLNKFCYRFAKMITGGR